MAVINKKNVWDNTEFDNFKKKISNEDFIKIKQAISNKENFYNYNFFPTDVLKFLIKSIKYIRKPIP